MESIILIVHFFIALAMIGLILLQQGKGAEMGASFGSGGSNTVFGSSGGLSFFAKVTSVLATLFFVSSFALAIIARNNADLGGRATQLPIIQESAPARQQPAEEFPAVPGSEFEFDAGAAPSEDVPSE
jgi:preprotein translocase subunit SecG